MSLTNYCILSRRNSRTNIPVPYKTQISFSVLYIFFLTPTHCSEISILHISIYSYLPRQILTNTKVILGLHQNLSTTLDSIFYLVPQQPLTVFQIVSPRIPSLPAICDHTIWIFASLFMQTVPENCLLASLVRSIIRFKIFLSNLSKNIFQYNQAHNYSLWNIYPTP